MNFKVLTRPVENRNLTDKEEIENALKLGEYIKKGSFAFPFRRSVSDADPLNYASETLALYSLRKYRHLKNMYPNSSMSDP